MGIFKNEKFSKIKVEKTRAPREEDAKTRKTNKQTNARF